MNGQVPAGDKSSYEYELPYRVLEKRIMISVALLGSFLFGFIFFGHAPSILGLLVFLGPIEQTNMAPKLLGLMGIVLMVFSFRWREAPQWLPVTTAGASAFLGSWWMFFGMVDHNFITLLGTTPFLFFVLWFVTHLVKETGVLDKLNRRLAPQGEVPALQRYAVSAGFLESLTEPLKRWISDKKGGEEKGSSERLAEGQE